MSETSVGPTSPGAGPVERRAARVLVVDPAGRVLMFRGFDPATPHLRYWFTAGGGLEPHETPAQAAVRELAEETGLRFTEGQLGEPVWHDVAEFPFNGRRYRQEQDWFLVRVPAGAVDRSGFDAVERATIDAVRWWSAADFAATGESYYPPDLPALLRRVGVG